MYKLIVLDLDGTILNNHGEISEYTRRTIKEVKQKGSEIVIASGRTIDSVKTYATDIFSDKYIIAGNGSIIYDAQKEIIIYKKIIPKSKVLNIIKICEENSIVYSVYTCNTIIADSLKYNILYYYKQNLKLELSKKTSITIVPNIYDYIKNSNEEVIKILICDKHKSIFNSIIKRFSVLDDIEVSGISNISKKVITNGTNEIALEYYYTEITEKNVDKWDAVQYLSQLLNISNNEIMVIGDNINDKKMIENAGLGIAMKGSQEDITQIANYITDYDNNHDGAAKAIEKYTITNE